MRVDFDTQILQEANEELLKSHKVMLGEYDSLCKQSGFDPVTMCIEGDAREVSALRVCDMEQLMSSNYAIKFLSF
jgi:hypothetical protein